MGSGTVGSFSEWLAQLNFGSLYELLAMLAAVTLSLTVHETCHGLTAFWLGDDTAQRAGRLTLNPLKHISLTGFIMLAVCHFGWAKPVPVDMRNFRHPKWGMALTAAAGPLSNVLLSYVTLVLWLLLLFLFPGNVDSGFLSFFCYFLQTTASLCCGLAVFNLFPIPPLDGSKVLFSLLPDELYRKLMVYERYGMILLVIVLFTNVLDRPLSFLYEGLFRFIWDGSLSAARFIAGLLS